MTKTLFLILIAFYSSSAYTQNDFFILKKRNKSIQYFWKDSHITLQLKNNEWVTGIITNIVNDSFYLKQELIHYHLMGADTFHFSGLHVALKDVYAMPRKNELFVYDNDGVKVILGNERFVWVKNGWLFRWGGGSYVGLNIINDLIKKNPPFARNNIARLGIGTAVFLIGELLNLNYKPTLRMGKKYHLEYLNLQNSKSRQKN